MALVGIQIINNRSLRGLDAVNAVMLATVEGGARLTVITLAVLVKGKLLLAFLFLFCGGLTNAAFFYRDDILINYAVLGLWLVVLPIAIVIRDMPVSHASMLCEGLRSQAATSGPWF